MITDNQTSNIDSAEVGGAPTASVDSVGKTTASATAITEISSTGADSDSGNGSTGRQSSEPLSTVQPIDETGPATSGASGVLPLVSIALTLVLAYFLYKLKREFASLKKKIDGNIVGREKDSQTTELKLQDMARRLTDLQDMDNSLLAKLDSLAYKIKENRNSLPNLELNTSLVEVERQTSVNQENNGYLNQCYYGNPFSPDENGVVKFSTRTLSKEQSPQKMFFVCLHPDGTGTYEVNPSANEYILTDLQLFSYYVKPFNFKGQLTTARVKTLRPGKLVKSDKFWVIEELLEVSFK